MAYNSPANYLFRSVHIRGNEIIQKCLSTRVKWARKTIKQTNVKSPCHYVFEHQLNKDVFVQLLICAYNERVYRSTITTRLILSCHITYLAGNIERHLLLFIGNVMSNRASSATCSTTRTFQLLRLGKDTRLLLSKRRH